MFKKLCLKKYTIWKIIEQLKQAKTYLFTKFAINYNDFHLFRNYKNIEIPTEIFGKPKKVDFRQKLLGILVFKAPFQL